ncbi:MAG: hypothetical protein H0V65_00955 [Chitinophagales bacterium]|nr:hypothetical protein [Chitinophagales bacterium]
MKTLIHISLLLLLTTGTLVAQDKGRNKIPLDAEVFSFDVQSEVTMFDKIQKETESISAIKPLVYIASIIESRVNLKQAEKQAIAASILKNTKR